MPLTLTTPQAIGNAATYVITQVIVDPESGNLAIGYQRLDGSGNVLDQKLIAGTAAALLAATGANLKAKAYAYLSTLTSEAGTVT